MKDKINSVNLLFLADDGIEKPNACNLLMSPSDD